MLVLDLCPRFVVESRLGSLFWKQDETFLAPIFLFICRHLCAAKVINVGEAAGDLHVKTVYSEAGNRVEAADEKMEGREAEEAEADQQTKANSTMLSRMRQDYPGGSSMGDGLLFWLHWMHCRLQLLLRVVQKKVYLNPYRNHLISKLNEWWLKNIYSVTAKELKIPEKCCCGNCASYRGEKRTTISGAECKPWIDLPASHSYYPVK